MTSKNLAGLTTDLIESYGNTAKNVINAYRAGNERVIGLIDQRWESALGKSATKLSADVRDNALSAQKRLSAFYVKGIGVTADSADSVVDKVVELAAKGAQQIAANAGTFEKNTKVKALHTLAVAAVPAVEAVARLAGKIEQQSGRLANRLAGQQAVVTVAAVKRVTPFKKARTRKAA